MSECEHDWRDRISVSGTRVRMWIECAACGAIGVEEDGDE